MKNRKKINKILSFFMTITMVCTLANATVFAAAAEIKTSVVTIVNAIAYFGYAIAFGMLFYLGAKYTMASANEKADVKQGSINYLIGAFLILCASGVANLFSSIAAGGSGGGASVMASEIVNAATSVAN